VPYWAPFVQYRTGSDIGILFQSSKRLTVPESLAFWHFKKLYEGFKGYSLHVYTSDSGKANILDVQTAGDGKAYTLHVCWWWIGNIHTSNCGKA
jgi:hypothetical protein